MNFGASQSIVASCASIARYFSRSALLAGCRLPPAMDPIPLLGMPQHQPLERSVERARRRVDRFVGVLVVDGRNRLFEAQHVPAVRLAPAGGGQHRRAGCERDDRETLERARRMTEELDVDAVGAMRVLIEWKHDDVAGFEAFDDPVERASLAHDAEAGAIETPIHELIEPARLDRPAHEMEAAVDFRIVLNAGDGRDLPVAEVTGEDQHAFALAESRDERIQILDADERALPFQREPPELEELDSKLCQVRVMRLGQPFDFARRNRNAEDASKIVQHHTAAKRQSVEQDATR